MLQRLLRVFRRRPPAPEEAVTHPPGPEDDRVGTGTRPGEVPYHNRAVYSRLGKRG